VIPSKRPQETIAQVLSRISGPVPEGVCLVGARGYYLNSMGRPGVNDRGLYDDAMFILGPTHFSAWNANTDPTIHRKAIAVLRPGRWQYKPGTHGLSRPASQRYAAFVQAGPVTVDRDGEGPETGWFGINIHRGGYASTSSLGCQTLPPNQWDLFRATLNDQLRRANQRTFTYILTT
jgi:lysozyme